MTKPITGHHDIALTTTARWPRVGRATTATLATSGPARAPPRARNLTQSQARPAHNGATGTVTATIPVGGTSVGVAINPLTNTIYVTDFQAKTVSVISG